MNRVFVDLDGVVVDFDSYAESLGLSGAKVKTIRGAYLEMKAFPGALESVRSLIGMGYEVWIATKPPTGISYAYADKVEWVLRHLPELKRRIILTHDKGLLGDFGDYLIDDRPHKNNCENFEGHLIAFKKGNQWPEIIAAFRERQKVDF
jgi:5'(3')-deoxyribonucleotidase